MTNTRNLGFTLLILLGLSACGQKGPLVLERVPVDATQAPLESSIDTIPVETPEEDSESTSES